VASPLALRSVLFVPGANARAIEKARSLKQDATIYDLEDSVADTRHEEARANVITALTQRTDDRPLIVRVSHPRTESGQDDLRTMVDKRPDAILLPKIDSAETIIEVRRQFGVGTPLWAMIETPLGILSSASIAATIAESGGGALIVGPNDIQRLSGLVSGPERVNFLPWLMQIALAAKAHGLSVLDGVYNDFGNDDGLVAEARQARDLGFDGKTLIHPRQIDPCNAAFAPEPQEIAWAQMVVSAFADPAHVDANVVSVDGSMVERLHLEVAARILARSR